MKLVNKIKIQYVIGAFISIVCGVSLVTTDVFIFLKWLFNDLDSQQIDYVVFFLMFLLVVMYIYSSVKVDQAEDVDELSQFASMLFLPVMLVLFGVFKAFMMPTGQMLVMSFFTFFISFVFVIGTYFLLMFGYYTNFNNKLHRDDIARVLSIIMTIVVYFVVLRLIIF